jgi:hypothetical protein
MFAKRSCVLAAKILWGSHVVRYQIDTSRLMDLSGEVGSYWAGYLHRKASITKGGYRLQVTGKLADIGHLSQLARDANSTIMPRLKEDRCYLHINNKELCDFYAHLKLSDVMEERHFIRGLWDAKGSVGKIRKSLRIGIGGPLELLEWVREIFNSGNKIQYQRSWVIRWQGKKAVAIVKWMYLNQTRCLARKFEKMKPYIFENPFKT